ncbi:MAG: YjbE family putative metal transport protein [Ethanoligenens sp.]
MTWPELFLKGIQIVFLNLVLSGDNVGIIALAIKDLPPRKAKWANLLGGCAAMVLRILFIAMLGVILSFRFLHLHFAGGVLLLFITYQMMGRKKHTVGSRKRGGSGLFQAVASIVAADLSMSFDNALAVASIVMTNGGRLDAQKMGLIVIGLLVCVPVIFWGGAVMARLMERRRLFIYLCTAILVYTAVGMIFADDFFAVSPYSYWIGIVCGVVCGALTFFYGMALDGETRAAPWKERHMRRVGTVKHRSRTIRS